MELALHLIMLSALAITVPAAPYAARLMGSRRQATAGPGKG